MPFFGVVPVACRLFLPYLFDHNPFSNNPPPPGWRTEVSVGWTRHRLVFFLLCEFYAKENLIELVLNRQTIFGFLETTFFSLIPQHTCHLPIFYHSKGLPDSGNQFKSINLPPFPRCRSCMALPFFPLFPSLLSPPCALWMGSPILHSQSCRHTPPAFSPTGLR